VGGVLAACGNDDQSADGGGAKKAVAKGKWPDLSGVTLTMATYGGETGKAADKALGQPFAKLTGCTVRQDGPIDSAKLQAQVESNNVSWDIVHVDGFRSLAPVQTKLYEPIDKSIVDLSNLNPDFAVSDNTAPFFAYSQVFAYNKSLSPPPSGWADFFDTEKYPGKRTAYNAAYAPNTGLFEAALLADGVAVGELFPMDLDRVFKKLDTIKSDYANFDTYAQAIEQLTSGEVKLSIVPNGIAYQSASAGGDVAVAWDQNIRASESIGVTKNGKNVEAAMWFLKYILSPEAQAKFAELTSYDPVTLDAKPKLSAEAQSFSSATEEHLAVAVQDDWEYYAANYEEMISRWVEWASG
jgi:putative spermidine/putrescine transport system substrate-binding protein